ncbi:EAL domain-containing protein [Methylophaga sp. OBS3]|uniref:EAL domain-containing protein n=1 Tax=Methylophaga sp. OBS3 TaxID=2991934 RepID=UPI0022567734|nr:EAL domain-containing protein [Methylophaga sp. OBS3]MCX4189596.1 EAL domain-containing protein [Methylophaga sp. OBS3]
MSHWFRLCIICLLTCLGMSVAHANEPSPETVTLKLKWQHQFQFAGYYAALANGYYQDENLDVVISAREPGEDVVETVLNGDADFGVGGIGLLAEYATGTPIKALAAIFQHDALVLISKRQSGIVSPYELRDKRIMFDQSSGNDVVLRALLADSGLLPGDYQEVSKIPDIQSLIDDKVDVISGYVTDQPFRLRSMGVPVNVINPQSYGYDFYGDILFTSDKELRNFPDRATRFKRASLKGWRYALENPKKIIDLIIDQYDTSLSREQLIYEAQEIRNLVMPDLLPIGQLEVARLRRAANIYNRLGIAPALSETRLSGFIADNSSLLHLTPAEEDWLTKHPVVRLGVDRDFAPYEWINDNGDYVGLAAEYIHLLEDRLKIKFEIVADRPWHQIMDMAKRGELDMLACVNSNPQRDEYLDFTLPYITNPIVIVNANRYGFIGTLENLTGKTVAVERDYYVQEKLARHYPAINLLLTDTTREALEKVATGEADAYVGDAAYSNYAIKQADLINLQFAGQTGDMTAYRIAVNPAAPQLLSMINKVLASLTYEEKQNIENRWMGLSLPAGPSTELIWQIALGLIIISVIFLLWMLRLRQSKNVLSKSENRLRTILNTSPVPHALYDENNNVTFLNQAFIDTFGYTLEDVPTVSHWWPLAYPDKDYREQVQSLWKEYLGHIINNDDNVSSLEVDIHCKHGQKKHVLANATLLKDGKSRSFIVILYDISERKRAEEKLKLSGRVFNQAHEGILITDARGLIVDINPAFTEITGYSRAEVINRPPSLLKSGKHEENFYQEMWQQLKEKGHWQGEVWNRRKNGELFAELLTISTLVDEYGDTLHYLGLFSDITRTKEQQQALEMMAHYDILTRLPNRSLFADRFQQAIAHSDRQHSLLGVVFLDLDGFKPINDRYGHEVGDQLLVEVAQRIKACIHEDDTASRLGGDEFAILLNELGSVEHCERMIGRLQRTIAMPYKIDDANIRLSASLGVTLYPLDHADADTLLRHADQAMYQAKQSGRNQHYLFDALHDQQRLHKQNQIAELQHSFNSGQLAVFYQPKVNMRTGNVIGFEALIRWQHPERGLLEPAEFLPLINNNDLEVRIGNWVIEQALNQLQQLQQINPNISISVNVSAHHLQWSGFYDALDFALSKYPSIDSSYLLVEVLESSVLSDIHNISSIIRTCRKGLGIRIALDDFGTGYSSLSHLRHLPVDIIKIDQSFVRDILDDANDFTIVDGVIGLTEAFQHEVIAEGVETLTHGRLLMTIGCDVAQGYAISGPMPATTVANWLNDYHPIAEWLEHARIEMNPQQRLLTLMQLQTENWLQRVIKNLQSDPDDIHGWPILNPKKNHFNYWVEQARKEDLFNQHWLDQLKLANMELFHAAAGLKNLFEEDQHATARSGITELQTIYQQIERLLNQPQHW